MTLISNAAQELPPEVIELERFYSKVLHDRCPGLVDTVVTVGSARTGDFIEGRSDLDLVTIVTRPPTAGDVEGLAAVHQDMPRGPLLDVIYIPAGALPQQPTDRTDLPFCVGGNFFVDGKSCLVSAVLWAEVREAAPPGTDVGPPIGADVLRARGRSNLSTYWQSLLTNSRTALASHPTDRAVSGAMIAWLVLGVGRAWHTAVHGRLITKSAVGPALAEVSPRHADLIGRAIDWRAGRDSGPFCTADAIAAAELAQNLIDRVA